MSVAPDGTAFVACASEPGAGFQAKSVLRSTDGGARWEIEVSCALVPKPSAACSSSLNSGYLGGITALSSSRVLVYGGRASLLVSGDGGAHWRPAHPIIGDSGSSSGPVVRFDGRHALALGADPAHAGAQSIWATSDGGTHWRRFVPLISQGP